VDVKMDLKEFLDEYDIESWDRGKNVQAGCINIQCPFCDDQSNHLGIRLRDHSVKCWKCGKKSFIQLVKTLLNVSYKEAREISKKIETKIGTSKIDVDLYQKLIDTEGFCYIPKESTVHFPKIHKEYLRQRGFAPLKLIREYKLRAVYTTGKYAFRIIIPIYRDHKLVSFTSRDITDQSDIPYLHASPDEALIKAKQCVYNIDTVPEGGEAALVEGVFDCWKLGDRCVSTLGTNLSGQQYAEIARKNLKRLYILNDNDRAGKIAARITGQVLAPVVRHVEIVSFVGVLKKVEDPGKLTREQAEVIMRELGLRH
jgi:DNA primase